MSERNCTLGYEKFPKEMDLMLNRIQSHKGDRTLNSGDWEEHGVSAEFLPPDGPRRELTVFVHNP